MAPFLFDHRSLQKTTAVNVKCHATGYQILTSKSNFDQIQWMQNERGRNAARESSHHVLVPNVGKQCGFACGSIRFHCSHFPVQAQFFLKLIYRPIDQFVSRTNKVSLCFYPLLIRISIFSISQFV